mmetsp:Transcript_18038/g.40773  ORF Transcript_18038/g.40773 Transcript_18038/m.40773 type:complete len:333 (+) Transcript_18038:40-1038(+)
MRTTITAALSAAVLLGRCRDGLSFAPPRPSAGVRTRGPANGVVSLDAEKAREGTVMVTRSDGEHELAYRIVRPMNLSSAQAAPIVALHGGPSVPSDYLYPLGDVVPYRSIVFYDQLGCGKSDKPDDASLYSTAHSVDDLRVLLRKIGVRRFHLYGQSYGGILGYEYLKRLSEEEEEDEPKCLSLILSSAPTSVSEVEENYTRLLGELKSSNPDATEEQLGDLFRVTHQCRLPVMPEPLVRAYEKAGTVWRGTGAISGYEAAPPKEGARRMPSALTMRGEHDFISEWSLGRWGDVLNTPFVRRRTMEGCGHHPLLEDGATYGEIIESYVSEYD